MTQPLFGEGAREERLEWLILEYTDALHTGSAPDRRRFLEEHQDCREELESFFAGLDCVERVAAPLREATALAQDRPTPPCSAQAGEAPGLGQLGDFELLREVGRGGMGVVYEAVQMSLNRRVALKVLPFLAAIDPRVVQRFKNEALAAANLRHENIVPVYAIGSERGVHYYAMQFIEGQSLAELIAEMRQPPEDRQGDKETGRQGEGKTGCFSLSPCLAVSLSSGGEARKRWAWVAALGRQAAGALEHAHRTGIVHRDVKPANLLLDAQGTLWITDFGLAQMAADASLTQTGELLGTLRYMSPEQAGGQRVLVDQRTDVYSLGATLYELMTLRPLFDSPDRQSLLRQILSDEPPPPRSIDRAIPVELETIVLKSLAKTPQDRYATAGELADDLQRFLDDRPILARRPTATEHLRKWARRHPGLVVAGVVMLSLLSAGSLVSTALIHVEQRKAEESYRRERLRADEAEARFRLARSSVDELFRVSEEELADRPGMEGLRKRLLTSVLAYYLEFIEQRGDDPDARAELLDTKHRVEKILADLAVLRAAGQIHLLNQPAVLDELTLNEVQRTKVKDLSRMVDKQWKESFGEFGRLSRAERAKRFLERARANESAVNSILDDKQRRRLYQIGLQCDVAGAFREPEVAAALALTAEQRERIRSIEDDAFFALMKPFRPGPPPAPRGGPPEVKPLPTNDRLLEVLTGEQLGRWRELTGAPFKGAKPFWPRFGPPGLRETR